MFQRTSCRDFRLVVTRRFPSFQHGVSHVKKVTPILLLGLVAATSLPIHATPISTTIELGTVSTGAAPSGSASWLTATFTSDTGTNTGTLALTSHLNGS